MARSPEDASHFWRGIGWIDVGGRNFNSPSAARIGSLAP
jgi:hypothetical protein